MNILPTPARIDQEEWIDSVEPDTRDFERSFADVERVNRFLGGAPAIHRTLEPLLASLPPDDGPVRILDVATGSADIPRSLVRAARAGRLGERPLEIVGIDNHRKVLALARIATETYPEITIADADARALPYPDNSFDIALCSLAFHHLGPDGAVRALREMVRVARHAVVVNDLLRDRVAWALIWALTRLLSANRLTRHDGPVSVLRAYTLREYEEISRMAGLRRYDVRPRLFYRAVVVGYPEK